VTQLRESFRGINARFHLVGFYTLAALLLRIAESVGDDPTWVPALAAAFLLFHGGVCGVLGLVYQAAAGRSDPLSFARYSTGLFFPFLWLSIKISLMVYGLAAAAAGAYHVLSGAATPIDRSLATVIYWAGPLIGLGMQALALFSMPLCILAREKRVRVAPIREGGRLFRSTPESRWLLLLLVAIAGLGGALQYTLGPERIRAAPDVPEALVLFVNSYLALVAFFGATRLVLARSRNGIRREIRSDADAAAPGPPA
jgi:hypothetical protein